VIDGKRESARCNRSPLRLYELQTVLVEYKKRAADQYEVEQCRCEAELQMWVVGDANGWVSPPLPPNPLVKPFHLRLHSFSAYFGVLLMTSRLVHGVSIVLEEQDQGLNLR